MRSLSFRKHHPLTSLEHQSSQTPGSTFSSPQLQETSPREAHTLDGSVISEPTAAIAGSLVDEGTGQAIAVLEDALHDVPLATAGSDKGDANGVGDNGQREGDAPGRGLGRVLDGGDPGVGLAQERVAREQAAGVAVGAGAEQQQVEDGQLDGVAAGERPDQQLLVLVGELLGVVEVLGVDGVDGGRALLGRDPVEQVLLQQAVVAVLVVERDGALVAEEDLPLAPVHAVVVGLGRRQQRRRQRLRQRPARHAHLEGAVARKAGVLALDDVGAQRGRQGVDALEGEEVRLLANHRSSSLSLFFLLFFWRLDKTKREEEGRNMR